MRTLKKTLALVLVLAMMFSLCVTASADFADAEEIKNDLAVNTLVALGVIEGMPDGAFDPAGTLTRAQAAAILCRMLGLDAYIEQCATPFTDVAESHWASGYIAYCADAGIIAGYGDGKFGPSDALTGYAWAKMLLVAFNLVPTDKDGNPTVALTGSAWQINTAKLATTNKLWVGDDSSKKEAATRDNACLVAFNALKPDVKEGVVYDEFGAPVATEWTIAIEGEKKPVVVDSEAIEPVLTYTAGVKAADIKKDLGLAEKDFAKADLGEFTEAGKGVLVKVYAADNKETKDVAEYSVYVIETKVAVLAKEDITKADEKKEIKASIDLDGITYETDAYAEGDVVLYNVGKDAEGKTIAVNVAKAEAKTVKVTAKGTGYVKAGADKYEFAVECKDNLDLNKEWVLYLDQYGYIKDTAAPAGAAPAVTPDTLVYVVDYYTIDVKGTPAVKNEFGVVVTPAVPDKTETYAQVVNMDGEIETYLVAVDAKDFAGDKDCIKAIKYNETTKVYDLNAASANAVIEKFAPVDGKISVGGIYYDKAEYVSILGSLDKITVAEGSLKGAADDKGAWAVYSTDEKTGHKSVTKVFYWAEKEPEVVVDTTYSYAIAVAADSTYSEVSTIMVKGADGKETPKSVYTHTVYINGEKTTILTYTETIARDFYMYAVDEYGVYELVELDGLEAKVDYVYGNYVTVGEYVDYDITGIKVVDLTKDGNGTIEAGETIALYAYKKAATDKTYTIDCIYIIAAAAKVEA